MPPIRTFFTVLAISLLFIACRKDAGRPPRETFPIEYQFINNADANVKAAVFYTTTFYPNDTIDASGDSTSLINWYDHAFNDLNPGDLVRLPLNKKGYVGCVTQLKIRVVFKKPMFSPVLFDAGWDQFMTYSRNYVGPVDTIRSPSQNIIKFNWPQDTLRYTEVKYF
jgi:hypothetical protein